MRCAARLGVAEQSGLFPHLQGQGVVAQDDDLTGTSHWAWMASSPRPMVIEPSLVKRLLIGRPREWPGRAA